MSSIFCSLCKITTSAPDVGGNGSLLCCPHCGAVVDDEQVFTHDETSKDFSGAMANPDGSRMYGPGFETSQRRRLPSNSLNYQTRNRIKKHVENVCSQLCLSKDIQTETITFIVENVFQDTPLKRSRDKIILVGACIYIVSRSHNLPITLTQIGNACWRKHYTIGALAKLIARLLNIVITPTTVPTMLPVMCSYLDNPKECEELAMDLYTQTVSEMSLTCSIITQCIAHTVIASLAVNKHYKQTEVIKLLQEKMCVSSDSFSVAVCVRKLKRNMIERLAEVPWVKVANVKMSNVHGYAKTLARFWKNIGHLRTSGQNPSWYQEKDRITSTRQQKIKQAQERIKLKKMSVQKDDGRMESLHGNLTENNAPLDKEDEIIEELLEMGCTAEDIQEGYYDVLKTTLSTSVDILDHEIDSYVRTPEEVEAYKKMQVESDDDDEVLAKRPKIK